MGLNRDGMRGADEVVGPVQGPGAITSQPLHREGPLSKSGKQTFDKLANHGDNGSVQSDAYTG